MEMSVCESIRRNSRARIKRITCTHNQDMSDSNHSGNTKELFVPVEPRRLAHQQVQNTDDLTADHLCSGHRRMAARLQCIIFLLLQWGGRL